MMHTVKMVIAKKNNKNLKFWPGIDQKDRDKNQELQPLHQIFITTWPQSHLTN